VNSSSQTCLRSRLSAGTFRTFPALPVVRGLDRSAGVARGASGAIALGATARDAATVLAAARFGAALLAAGGLRAGALRAAALRVATLRTFFAGATDLLRAAALRAAALRARALGRTALRAAFGFVCRLTRAGLRPALRAGLFLRAEPAARAPPLRGRFLAVFRLVARADLPLAIA